ncbi:hypothetical protein Pmani_030908 [Petrolisthes manimaculis]|uniref:Uncharacterized protein n=1 Tax=Petrolisthes manimaculis TaxID=1843537 RepID=A0AAE1NUP3_9EUCA|nr:hypothetical protein Pmani_030908 [Petrolisthes manimaculis]
MVGRGCKDGGESVQGWWGEDAGMVGRGCRDGGERVQGGVSARNCDSRPSSPQGTSKSEEGGRGPVSLLRDPHNPPGKYSLRKPPPTEEKLRRQQLLEVKLTVMSPASLLP